MLQLAKSQYGKWHRIDRRYIEGGHGKCCLRMFTAVQWRMVNSWNDKDIPPQSELCGKLVIELRDFGQKLREAGF